MINTNSSIHNKNKNNEKPSTFDDLVVKVQGVLEASPADMNRGLKSKLQVQSPSRLHSPQKNPINPLQDRSFRKLGVPSFGLLNIRILLFRVPY